MSTLKEVRESREILVNLTAREIRGKYKRTFLGQGWSLLNPVAQMAIFTLVFGVLLRADPPQGDPSGLDLFALWLAAGLLPWTFFSQALANGMTALLTNAALVKKVYFPREVLVASTVLSFVVTLFVELGVLTVVLLLAGGQPLPWLPLVVAAVVLLTAFTLGLALALSIAMTYFRDTGHLMAIVLQFWFYLTPVVYPPQLVDEAVGPDGLTVLGVRLPVDHLYGLNPMERFLSIFRALLYDNRLPHVTDVIGAVLATTVSLLIGVVVFRRWSGRLAEEL